ncbi:MAG: hypothetical protein AMJ90_05920 [candidate division Zixibacteria bacterium SM23_73_2]|nr:MAG: hypothetical protein AMJ90_05920 [candidate division Zixibacteria bacterium SM23_73_2]
MNENSNIASYRRFLKPDVVSKLSGIEIKARLVVEGFIAGLHKSPYHGFSVEFAEHRQYMPGDSIRNIDWKVYAKSDRYFVKEFEEETNLKAYILLDTSASMGYKSNGIHKLEYSSYLSAALAYLMLKQRDSVGLVVFDEHIRKYLPPKSTMSHLHNLLKELDKLNPSRTTDISLTLHEMAERIKRRGLIIVISDLLDDPDLIINGLKHFRHKKHEVLVFHILDSRERDFGFTREAVFKDLETGEEILTSPWQIRKDYKEKLSQIIKRYTLQCRESIIDYVLLDTSVPYDIALFSYLSKRKRLF